MTYQLDVVKEKLADNKTEEALQALHGWLSAGDRSLVRHLTSLKRKRNQRSVHQELTRLVSQLEAESPRLNQFLSHYHQAQEAFKSKDWDQAEMHLQEALSYHQPEYLTSRIDLETRLDEVLSVKKLSIRIDKGKHLYNGKQWTEALNIFQEVEKSYVDGVPHSLQEIKEVIATCQKGVSFERHVTAARESQSNKEWPAAIRHYQAAISCYHPDFGEELEVLHEEVAWCGRQAEAEKSSAIVDKPLFIFFRKYAFPILMVVVLFTIIWLFMTQIGTSDQTAPDGLASNGLTDPLTEGSPGSGLLEGEEIPGFIGEDGQPLEAGTEPEPFLDEGGEEGAESGSAVLLRADFSLRGSMKAGEPVSISIPNYNAQVRYDMDFGNGIRRRVRNGQAYVYPGAGIFRMTLQAVDAEGNTRRASRVVTISGSQSDTEVLADSGSEISTEPSPAAPAEVVRETVYVRTPPEVSAPAPAQEAEPDPVPAQPAQSASSEVSTPAPATVTAPLQMAEVDPIFPGGEAAMVNFLQSRINYPTLAKENDVEGTVYLRFVVEADGRLSGFRILRGLGFGCDEEALRVARQMPNWRPGKQGGNPVPVYYTIPIRFEIP